MTRPVRFKARNQPLRFKLTIVSGGQSGADMAALRFARKHNLPHAGWCPRGRKQESGVIPPQFGLRETPSRGYAQRTRWNVRDSDGTLVFSLGKKLEGGARKTVEFARELRKPCLHLSQACPEKDPVAALRKFMRDNRIWRLNVAGPRESQEPGIGRFVTRILKRVFVRPQTPTPARSIRAHSRPATRPSEGLPPPEGSGILA